MGFTNRATGGSKFLSFKDGKIIHKSDTGDKVAHGGFVGLPIDVDIVDAEFDKKPYRKVILFLEDPETGSLLQLEFSVSSGYGNAFSCICTNITPGKLIEISGKSTKVEGKVNKQTGMFVSIDNGGEKFDPVKWYITKENAEKMKRPEPKKVKINRVDTLDFGDRNEYYEKVIFAWRKKLVHVTKGVLNWKPKKSDAPAVDTTEPADDLPF